MKFESKIPYHVGNYLFRSTQNLMLTCKESKICSNSDQVDFHQCKRRNRRLWWWRYSQDLILLRMDLYLVHFARFFRYRWCLISESDKNENWGPSLRMTMLVFRFYQFEQFLASQSGRKVLLWKSLWFSVQIRT